MVWGTAEDPMWAPKVLQCRPLHLPLAPPPKVSLWKVCRGPRTQMPSRRALAQEAVWGNRVLEGSRGTGMQV